MKTFLIVIFVFILTSNGTSYGGNLMPNSGAEKTTKTSGAVEVPGVLLTDNIPALGWTIRKLCGTAVFGVTDAEKHSGNYSVFCELKQKNSAGDFEMHIKVGESLKNDTQEGLALNLKPDTIYYFSFWMKTKGSFRVIGRYEEWETGMDKSKLKYMGIKNRATFPPTSEWKKYEITFTTSSKMERCIPILHIKNTLASEEGDIIFIDDIEIMPFDEKYL